MLLEYVSSYFNLILNLFKVNFLNAEAFTFFELNINKQNRE